MSFVLQKPFDVLTDPVDRLGVHDDTRLLCHLGVVRKHRHRQTSDSKHGNIGGAVAEDDRAAARLALVPLTQPAQYVGFSGLLNVHDNRARTDAIVKLEITSVSPNSCCVTSLNNDRPVLMSIQGTCLALNRATRLLAPGRMGFEVRACNIDSRSKPFHAEASSSAIRR